jgi:arsenite oxidase small subunit
MVKTGKPCPDGVGPEQDIVAYSLLCPHQGFPLVYDAGAAVFKCANHFSQFDAQMMGQMVCGQATAKLPRIWLEWDADSDMIHATGVSGLIYGRISNIMG